MGEWSEYFEDFPEENPANYDKGGKFDPNRDLRKEREKIEQANKKLDEIINAKKMPPRP